METSARQHVNRIQAKVEDQVLVIPIISRQALPVAMMSCMFSKKVWAVFFVLIFVLMVWLFFLDLNFEDNPIAVRFQIALFVISPVGNLWMIFDCLNHDRRWTSKIWLAVLLPFAFVWYYVERYRPRAH